LMNYSDKGKKLERGGMMCKVLTLWAGLVLIFLCSFSIKASPVRRVSINEVAWAGTKANPFDEWIELKNNTQEEIFLEGWKLVSESGKINILLLPPFDSKW